MAGEEPSAHALREIVVCVENCINCVDAGDVRNENGETRVKIPKVSWEVADKKLYEPEAVSIGPYHYNTKEPNLHKVQELKVRFASAFVERNNEGRCREKIRPLSVKELYGKVSEVAGEARKYYSQDELGGMADEEFTDVMFLDGCFVLEFIRRVPFDFTEHLQMDLKLIGLVMRDLLLLDNQVPFIVLEALSCDSTWLVGAKRFLKFSFPVRKFRMFQNDETYKPIHLLDLASLCFCDPRDRPPLIIPSGDWISFPSVTRLEEAGIDCWPAEPLRFSAIRFTPKLFTAELKIPTVLINEHSMRKWMNLAVYQIYAASVALDEARGTGVAEYIWMMCKLIDDAEDVRKLRAKQIIAHNFESDQQVVNLFRNMSKNLVMDMLAKFPSSLSKARHDEERMLVKIIHKHLSIKYKSWVFKNLYRPYFRSAWSIPAFLAAVIGLVLTFLQVYYAIYPRQLN